MEHTAESALELTQRKQKAKAEVASELAQFGRDQKRANAISCYRAALRNQILPTIAYSQQWDQPLDSVWGAKLMHMGVTAGELATILAEEITRFGGIAKLQGK